MKMEELIGRLEESGDFERGFLARTMMYKYIELEAGANIEIRYKSFQFLNGCLKTLEGLSEITEEEGKELWKEIYGLLGGEGKIMRALNGIAFAVWAIGAAGVMDMAGEFQPAAAVMVFAGLAVNAATTAMNKKKGARTW